MPFGATQDPRESQRKSVESRSRDPIRELTEIQQILRGKLDSDTLTAVEAAQLTRGYVEAEKLKRIIKGQPANTSQSIREPAQRKQPKASVTPLESLPETKPKE